MKRRLPLFFLTLSFCFVAALWRWVPGDHAVAAMNVPYPLDPTRFTSLGPSPFTTAGKYEIDASKNNANPTITGPGIVTPIVGVFHSPSSGATPNDEIAVFTFDSITIPTDVTVEGVPNANSRPVALLSLSSFTIDGIVNFNGGGGGSARSLNGNPGGAAAPGGGGGGGGGGGSDGGTKGTGGSGGPGFVAGETGVMDKHSRDFGMGGAGGSVSPNGGGKGGIDNYNGGGGAFGGAGAAGDFGGTPGGTAYGDLTTRLQGGSGGGGGGASGNGGGGGGGGGGAIEIGALTTISVSGRVVANGGGGGTNGGIREGGSGGGGGILIHTPSTVTFSSTGILRANGSGGGRIHIIGSTITGGCVDVAGGNPGVFTTAGTVVPATPQLIFGQQPTNRILNQTLSPAVTVRVADACGRTITTSTAPITLTLATNPGGATLGGTTTVAAVNGVATFTDLTLNQVGTGYTLQAASMGLTSATSTSFNITCPAPDTTITLAPPTTSGSDVSVSFTGSSSCSTIASFDCQLDGGGFSPCTSPKTYTNLTGGAHTFQVRARDALGAADASPAQVMWTVFTSSCSTVVNPATLPAATRGTPFVQTLSASPTGSYVFSREAGTLPPGINLVNTLGIYSLRGTPTTAGSYTFTIKAAKANSTCAGARTYTIVVP